MGESPTLGKFGGKFWKEGGKEEKGKGERKRGGKGKESQGKGEDGAEKKENCKRGGGKLKMKRERYENELRTFFFFFFFFFCFSLFETTEFVCGVLKWKFVLGEKTFLGGNFLTSPTCECTPGYAPDNY